MRKTILSLALLFAASSLIAADAKSIYDFTMNSIDGQPVSLKSYKGKVVLLVNVAASAATLRSTPASKRSMKNTRTRVL